MPRDKIKVAKVGDQWVVIQPAYGFGRPKTFTFDSFDEVTAALNPKRQDESRTAGAFDRVFQLSDGLSTVSPWTNLYRFRWLP